MDFEEDLIRDLAFFMEYPENTTESLLVNGSTLNTSILNTIKTADNSILSIGISLVKIRDYRLYDGLGYKNMSAYVRYLIKESQRDRSSIYKWLQIGEVYLKYKKELTEIGFSSKDGPTKLPYLEKALKNKPQKEVYDALMKMKQKEFSRYARSVVEDIAVSLISIDENIEENTDEHEKEREFIYFYKRKAAVKLNKKIGKYELRIMRLAIRLGFNIIARETHVCAVHLNSKQEYELFRPLATKAREELQNRLRE